MSNLVHLGGAQARAEAAEVKHPGQYEDGEQALKILVADPDAETRLRESFERGREGYHAQQARNQAADEFIDGHHRTTREEREAREQSERSDAAAAARHTDRNDARPASLGTVIAMSAEIGATIGTLERSLLRLIRLQQIEILKLQEAIAKVTAEP